MPAKRKAKSKKHLKRTKSLKKVKALSLNPYLNITGPTGGSGGGTGPNLGPDPLSPGVPNNLPRP